MSLQHLHRDLEEAQQTILHQGSSYEIVAAAPPDAPLLVLFDALRASGTLANVEPYVPPILPGSSVVDMPYIPSTLTQQPSQYINVNVEPNLSIETPADPVPFEPPIETKSGKNRDVQEKREEVETKKGDVQEKREETEAKKKRDAQVKEGEVKKKNEEASKKVERSKKREGLSSKKKDEFQKKGEGPVRRKEEDRDPAARRNADRDPAGSVSESSGDRRHTRSALSRSTPRSESPPHTVSSWEWREFLVYRRRTSASRPPFKKYNVTPVTIQRTLWYGPCRRTVAENVDICNFI